MRYHALACDYDGTLARGGRVDAATIAAIERVRASGRKLLLVTGRQLEDLAGIFPRLDLFDRAVLENGAVLHVPATGAVRELCPGPRPDFVMALTRRGVHPVSVGRCIVATNTPHETAVLEVIRDLGLELQLTFNKGSVMVLPSGMNKASGLGVALDELGLSPHNAVAVGDAENDHAFFDLCEAAVAVANSVPLLKQRADWVTTGDHGTGVQELVEALLADDLRELAARGSRHALLIGWDEAGGELLLEPYCAPVLVAGTSGAGKSTLATSLLEQASQRGYQYCIVDPEGDYAMMEGAIQIGDAKHAPALAEVLEVLAKPRHDVVLNLVGVPMADRPAFFSGFFPRLQDLRARTGRPHWLLVDEAHHLFPEGLDPDAIALPSDPHGLLLLTVHPEHVSSAVLDTVGTAIALGAAPAETLARFARADPAPHATGEGTLWQPSGRHGTRAVRIKLRPPELERRRHLRKYAAGDLGPDVSFYFRGPHGKLNLRANNLQMFLHLAEGVDEETWAFHLAQHDYSRWFRERIKDEDLAREAEEIELGPADDSRARFKKIVEQRYTAPA